MGDSVNSEKSSESRFASIKIKILSYGSLLLPLASSMPPFWSGLMTVPFILYLLGLIGSVTVTPFPASIYNVMLIFGSLLLILYCVVYLWIKKKGGKLVTSGPYRIVRHPQYFAVTIFTLITTYQSLWILLHTFGIGWLSTEGTWMLWIGMLIAYIGIASYEELHLQNAFGSEWEEYRKRVGFLIPFVKFKSRMIEGVICLLIPIIVLYVSLYLF